MSYRPTATLTTTSAQYDLITTPNKFEDYHGFIAKEAIHGYPMTVTSYAEPSSIFLLCVTIEVSMQRCSSRKQVHAEVGSFRAELEWS